MKALEYPIILASKSPRRSQLLKSAGFNFTVKTMEVEEDYSEELSAEEVAPYLARKKAMESQQLLTDDKEILLTADSVVILDDVIYGKPKDYDDAFSVLKKLSGQQHLVITGVCLKSKSQEKVFSGISEVQLYPMTDEEIDYYIRTFEPYDKAGSYAIQEWIGLCKIAKINGSYSNIMGLPVQLVYKELSKWVY